jgi:short-subunit dehydrogenase
MDAVVDKTMFGPWAIVTGASSGIGRAMAEHLGASGVHLVLVARRRDRLEQLKRELADRFGVDARVVATDLAEEGMLDQIERATADLDVGLLVGNAGFANPGELLSIDRTQLLRAIRLKVTTNLTLVHHFGQRLLARGRGGVLLVSSIGGLAGVPYVANTGAVEAYVLSLGEGLHRELEPHGIHVTVLMPGPTLTESMGKMGVDPSEMPIKPMKAERVAWEGLRALQANRPTHIAGRMNRFMSRLMPRSVATAMMGAMIGKTFARR